MKRKFLIVFLLFLTSFSWAAGPSNLSLNGIIEWLPTGLASMTLSNGLIVGSGSYDASISKISTGTIKIASYTVIPRETATPTGTISTGTLWMDGNITPPKLKCFDGSTWQSLW